MVDNRPNTKSPRIKFSRNISEYCLEGAKRILEIGCGTGSFTYLIDRDNCIAIDVDIRALKTAKKYCLNSEFILASLLNMPFRDEIFDVVFMWEVVEYLKKEIEKNAFVEIHRSLVPGAYLLLSAPNSHLIYNLTDLDYLLFRRQRHFKIKSLITNLIQTGFSINFKTIRGSWKSILAINIFYFYKHILHKRGGKLQSFLDKKYEQELHSDKEGITNIFHCISKELLVEFVWQCGFTKLIFL